MAQGLRRRAAGRLPKPFITWAAPGGVSDGRAVRRFAQHDDPWRGNAVFRAYIRKKMERGLRLQARFHAFQCGHGETPSPPYKSRLGRSNGAKGNRVRNRRAAVGAE